MLAKIGFDTAENEPCKVCQLSVYRSPRYEDGTGNWNKLTMSTYPFEFFMMIGASADEVTGWNLQGGELNIDSTSAVSSVDASGFIPSAAKLKGSIGQGPNHSNFSDRSSVRILPKFRNFR